MAEKKPATTEAPAENAVETTAATAASTNGSGPGRPSTKPIGERAMEQYRRTKNVKASFIANQAKLDRLTAQMSDEQFDAFKAAVEAENETPAESRFAV